MRTTIDVVLKHQIRIAKDTLRMNDVMARVMGGMSKDEAREMLHANGIKFNEGASDVKQS